MKRCVTVFGAGLAAIAGLAVLAGDRTNDKPVGVESPAWVATNAEKTVDIPKALPASPLDSQPADTKQANPGLSYETAQVLKLVQSGIDASVIKAYVANSQIASPPSAEEIIYLHHQGVSAEIVSLLIRRGYELQARANQINSVNRNAAASTAPGVSGYVSPTVVYSPAPVASTVYVYRESAPQFVYADYPRYNYYPPYNYGWYSSSWYYPWHTRTYYPSTFHRYRSFDARRPGPNTSFVMPNRGTSMRAPAWARPAYNTPQHFSHGNIGSWGGGIPPKRGR